MDFLGLKIYYKFRLKVDVEACSQEGRRPV